MTHRALFVTGLSLALSPLRARAGSPADEPTEMKVTSASAPPAENSVDSAEPPPSWRFEGAAYLYFVPESPDYVQPTLRVDHRLLHLEARYSYEDLLTGSAWVGVNAGGGAEVWWEITPMLGGAFGRTNGLALGYEGAVGFWKLELYSEGEYLFDFDPSADDFFFNWSEFTLSPFDWLRFGVMAERTRVFSSGRELERGLLAGVSWGPAFLTLHLLNPDDTRPVIIVAAGGTFER